MPRLHRRDVLVSALLLVTATAVGFLGAHEPRLFAAVAGLVGLCVAAYAAHRRPAAALAFAVFLVLLASTKFRNRDPSASMAGQIDGQIVGELALYVVIAAIIAADWLSIPAATGSSDRHSLRGPLLLTEGLVLFYGAFAVLSTAWSAARAVTLIRGTQLLIIALLAMRLTRRTGPEAAIGAMPRWLIVYLAIFATAGAFVRTASGSFVDYFGSWRFSWFAVHPITAAALSSLGLLFLLAHATSVDGSWRRRVLGVPSWLIALLLCVVIAATKSRGPAVALVFAAAFAYMRRYSSRLWAAPVVAASLTIGLLLLYNSGQSFGRILEEGSTSDNVVLRAIYRGQNAGDLESISGRAELWSGAIQLIAHRPVAGYGYQGSRGVLLEILPWAGHAHNGLAEAMLDLGVVGASVLWFALLTCLFPQLIGGRWPPPLASFGRSAIVAVSLFFLVDSISDPSFAGAPGFEVLLLFVCTLCGERLSRAASNATSETPADVGAAAVARGRRAA